jgi:methylated-DNA-[protein]-cysteine S-methyltransferase
VLKVHAPELSTLARRVLAVFGHRHLALSTSEIRQCRADLEATMAESKGRNTMSETFYIERFDTPTGRMLLVSDGEQRLRAADWESHEERMQLLLRRHYGAPPVLREAVRDSIAKRALEAYFEGELEAIREIPTATGGTEFQRLVWDALRAIRAGHTLSYGALAAKLGRPLAVRAVGLANGKNPIAIVVPCHRVVGADHSLTGYAGGIERKRWLLAHEGVASRESLATGAAIGLIARPQ